MRHRPKLQSGRLESVQLLNQFRKEAQYNTQNDMTIHFIFMIRFRINIDKLLVSFV